MHFLALSALCMSLVQSMCLLAVRWTWKVRVLIFQPKTILISAGGPSARCFIWLMISDLGVASFVDVGLKSVRIVRLVVN